MARLTIDDLDIERNGEAFEFETSDGTIVAFVDPKTIQAGLLISLETKPAREQLETVVGEGVDSLLADPKIDAYAMESLMEEWRKHHGLGSQKNARGSRRSSSATASTSKRTSPRGVSR